MGSNRPLRRGGQGGFKGEVRGSVPNKALTTEESPLPSAASATKDPQALLGAKKTNQQKTHKHFSDGPCGTIVPGTNPDSSQGQTGQNHDFTVELNRERPVCPRDGSHFVPGRGPICPRDGSCVSRTPSCRTCLCLLVFFFPDL